MDLINQYREEYGMGEDDRVVAFETRALIDSVAAEPCLDQDLKTIFGLLDLTTLNTEDNDATARKFTGLLNGFPEAYPGMPNVAAICVYPALVEEVRATLRIPEIKLAAVGAGFPSSQTFLSVKLAECELLVKKGADEVDIVISVGRLLAGDCHSVLNELILIREACGGATLKVILETGSLKSAENIRLASLIAMEAGADFIKTSTGKNPVSATPEAAYIMCRAIRDFYSRTGRMVGIKPAGGIAEVSDALIYYRLIQKLLGEEWVHPALFRIGASRLANNLLSQLKGQSVKYF
jgi:deoxyribose-phosphate aldolase